MNAILEAWSFVGEVLKKERKDMGALSLKSTASALQCASFIDKGCISPLYST